MHVIWLKHLLIGMLWMSVGSRSGNSIKQNHSMWDFFFSILENEKLCMNAVNRRTEALICKMRQNWTRSSDSEFEMDPADD